MVHKRKMERAVCNVHTFCNRMDRAEFLAFSKPQINVESLLKRRFLPLGTFLFFLIYRKGKFKFSQILFFLIQFVCVYVTTIWYVFSLAMAVLSFVLGCGFNRAHFFPLFLSCGIRLQAFDNFCKIVFFLSFVFPLLHLFGSLKSLLRT